MNILGIESSCDETAAAVVENGTKILSNIVASSADMHAESGGIIPENAARQQIKSIIPVITSALEKAKINNEKIEAIAVTSGPGLIGSLLVGIETAKTLSLLWNKPIIPVNHLSAHIYANWLSDKKSPEFPALALVVSGGHTDIVLMKDHGKLEWIGGTRDDAAGEAFDKTARLLGLPYPGGPAISIEAEKYMTKNPKTKLSFFPRPIINEKNYDWSFSGLKTAVLNEVKDRELNNEEKQKIAAEVQEAIVDVLIKKTLRAVQEYKPKSLLLAGGVAANIRLKEKFESAISEHVGKINLFVPPIKLCTDNAAYIASFAYFNHSPVPWQKINANPQLTITGQV
ncbi:tRNA (adenosine(37)-N6)-threonylcarbamoyltransferase complex transferase subunit TsaD [Patescibacteria group bacterium]|nr:tRNA (adenosine(37)-N6)-threonylcarbamoyltransferase complex transferase subunit TsaD [Patescibacteria group bacterium]MBU0776719.1 tRNA (adenosine(37)-N6)-threonylcarbamoyltransferase complex transferase subunit TsaD [Patescibacteria group bacterium]MBU0846163.1 tRNA (adenosine(37)-N6)-threonylcarbamoyltransferase complex transferase subunit TsaD [Patescibacteria group bacterium]MBU0922748.1 tRNA (adenosine(37)-N6)-threonylcarbamoyltransferase complex transferase subunit TsaD [Patescibacteri